MATTTTNYSIVIEQETNGTFSAYVAGVSGVYAAADTAAQAKRGIREALQAHLATLKQLGRDVTPKAEVLALRFTGHKNMAFANLGGLMLGRRTSEAKAKAARLNGRKGGRPRVQTAAGQRHR